MGDLIGNNKENRLKCVEMIRNTLNPLLYLPQLSKVPNSTKSLRIPSKLPIQTHRCSNENRLKCVEMIRNTLNPLLYLPQLSKVPNSTKSLRIPSKLPIQTHRCSNELYLFSFFSPPTTICVWARVCVCA